LFDVISVLPFPSLNKGKGFVRGFKSFLFEKAICDKHHIIIKKLRHSVITFTDSEKQTLHIRTRTAYEQDINIVRWRSVVRHLHHGSMPISKYDLNP